MPDPDILQQAAQNAPAVGVGGLAGSGTLVAIAKVFRLFASPQDVELLEARMTAQIAALKAEFAEKYVTQDMLKHIDEKLDNIQHRIDQFILQK